MSSSRSRLAPWLWVGPALVIVGGFLVYPVIVTIYDSLMNADLTKFIGLDNYAWAFTNQDSLLAFRNNIFWIIVGTAATVGLGLAVAVLSDRVRYESAAKAAIFMPMAISFVGAGVIWKFMYDWRPQGTPQIGLLNAVFTALQPVAAAIHGVLVWILAVAAVIALVTFLIALIRTRTFLPSFIAVVILPLAVVVVAWLGSAASSALGIPSDSLALIVLVIQIVLTLVASVMFAKVMSEDRFGRISLAGVVIAAICLGLLYLTNYQPITWIQDEATNNWALVAVYVWIWTGFCMVTLSAALKGIPVEVIEAARVDGATELQIFTGVLVPMIGPTILVVATTMVINILKVFDVVYVMTSGAYHTDVIANALYFQAFHFQNFGRGAALAVILLAAVVPVMVFNIRRFRQEEALR